MKEQIKSSILSKLPIVGSLRLSTKDNESLFSVDVVSKRQTDQGDKFDPFFEYCYAELLSYLTGKSKSINIKLDDSCLTAFELKVLTEVKKIPYATIATYGDLAKKLNTKGYQAIGSACGRNPFLLIYPCHRVVASNHLGGFAHGLDMKRELLKLEGHIL